MTLPITSITAALAALMLIGLSILVMAGRGKAKADLGDGGDKMLLSRIRRPWQFTETVPIALILLGLCEAAGSGSTALWAMAGCCSSGACFMLMRCWRAAFPPRAAGMLMTFASLLIGIVLLLMALFA